MRQIKLRDRLIEHQALDQDSNQVIIDQVPRQRQISQRRGRPKAILERCSV